MNNYIGTMLNSESVLNTLSVHTFYKQNVSNQYTKTKLKTTSDFLINGGLDPQ